jgi:hypothetical protein
VKEPNQYVNYNFSSFIVNKQIENFPIKIWEEEVKKLKHKEKKKVLKTVKSFITVAIPFVTLSSKSMAQSSVNPVTQQIGMPTDIIETLKELLKLEVQVAVFLAAGLLVFVGIMLMFKQREKAIAWTSDIIKGLTTCIIGIPLIFSLYYALNWILGGFDAFLKPF